MTHHHPLPTFRLEAGITMAQAEPVPQPPVTLDSPALEVMTDLTLIRPATTHPGTSLRQAEQMMIYKGVRMLFVVDDMPAIAGLITTTDLRGARPMQVVNARGLHFDELTVADVMTEFDLLDAVGFDRLQHASVGDAVATLKRFGRNHLLVAEDASEHHPRRVRGLISRSQIERQLGTAIPLTPIASSFSEIERALL